MIDIKRFPRLARYIETLPAGLESHPSCQAKGAIVRSMIEPDPLPAVPPDALPAQIRSLIAAPPLNSQWVPDVVYFGALLTLADARGMDDRAFDAWLLEANKKVFKGPVYRTLMSFASPGIMLTLGSSVWGSMHRGTHLSVERSKDTATAVLQFPDRLYDEIVLKTIAIAFLAAFQFSNAPAATLELAEVTPTSCRFRGAW